MSKAEGRRKQAEELFFLITYYENIHARRNYETDMDTRIWECIPRPYQNIFSMTKYNDKYRIWRNRGKLPIKKTRVVLFDKEMD